MSILVQEIPNMVAPFQDVARKIELFEININSDTKQFFVNYRIKNEKDNIDVSAVFKDKKKDWYIGNDKTVYQRNWDTFQPLPNPEYISPEETPNELQFLEAPAFDYLLQTFKDRPDLIWVILSGYILENYADGWFD
ncbi:hypothetical protein [Epilithonimonas hominis]|uniref:hypothetical protein n=1 Tax=Epilithonimonas hominis TaxID=420404 RepID=UPI000EE1707A|nr:hypothetical protein [Epilithonimonas hominis]HAP94529.1 hypothetical protein [Chryseobacterium sp.]